MEARYICLYYTECTNPASEWGDLATLARGMHMCKPGISYARDMDAIMGILRACRENVHANFHCGFYAILIFCCKIASVA